MGMFAGGFLRLFSTFIYFVEFCCAAVGLSIYSYFLAKLSYHHLHISNDWKAVEGLTGAAVLYTIFAVLLTCFLGGSRFFAILAIVFDLAFCGAFVAVAILTKAGAESCHGVVHTPLGTGQAKLQGAGTHLGLACKLNTAVFATAVIAALLFVVSIILQIFVMRHHQKEKKYGPSPANNYTSGSGGRFWKRQPKVTHDAFGTKDAEMAPVGTNGYTSTDNSYSTTTQSDTYGGTNKYDAYSAPQAAPYHTQPINTGTATNY